MRQIYIQRRTDIYKGRHRRRRGLLILLCALAAYFSFSSTFFSPLSSSFIILPNKLQVYSANARRFIPFFKKKKGRSGKEREMKQKQRNLYSASGKTLPPTVKQTLLNKKHSLNCANNLHNSSRTHTIVTNDDENYSKPARAGCNTHEVSRLIAVAVVGDVPV